MAPEFIEGKGVIVKNDGYEATFKQLKIHGETTVLHPLNPKYPDIELKKRGISTISSVRLWRRKKY